jgi:hypothetical protein
MALTFDQTMQAIVELLKSNLIWMMPSSLVFALIFYLFMQKHILDIRNKFVRLLVTTYVGTLLLMTNALWYFLKLFQGAFNSEGWGPLMFVFFILMFVFPFALIIGHLFVGLYGAKLFAEHSGIEKNDIKWLTSFLIFFSLFSFGSFLVMFWFVGISPS